jgi:hypothetical protein
MFFVGDWICLASRWSPVLLLPIMFMHMIKSGLKHRHFDVKHARKLVFSVISLFK